MDWPAAPFWSEIAAAFPDALILLSVRDVDAWWTSVSNTIFVALATYFADDAPDDGWTRMGRGMMTTFADDWQDEASAKAAYLAHNQLVRETAPGTACSNGDPRRGGSRSVAPFGSTSPTSRSPHQHLRAGSRRDGARPHLTGHPDGRGARSGRAQPCSSRSASRRPRPCFIASATQSWNKASMIAS